MPPPGMLIGGEDVYNLLQDYTLFPASQRLSLRLLQPPYTQGIRSILQDNGYSQIVSPVDKSGRSVLFWVNGRLPSTFLIKDMLAKDGTNRSLHWGPLRGKGSIELLESQHKSTEDARYPQFTDEAEPEPRKPTFSRWIIAFEDENEAWRFVRTWHQLPFPFPATQKFLYGEPPSLIHAEILW